MNIISFIMHIILTFISLYLQWAELYLLYVYWILIRKIILLSIYKHLQDGKKNLTYYSLLPVA